MSKDDRYLWDNSGAPDPEIERLETLLTPLAHSGRPLPRPLPARPRRQRWLVSGLALAAALAAVSVLSLRPAAWEVGTLSGAPRLKGQPLAGRARIQGGDSLVTDAGSSAWISIGKIGAVELGPDSRLRVLATRVRHHRLALDRGVLQARIVAPPREFVVDTPSATAIDLGCVYELEVDALGQATLSVLVGWVSFEKGGRETFVPAGARCATRGDAGVGTPYFTDASAGFKNALAEVDLAGPGKRVPAAALEQVLAEARREDAFSLWHLLVRVPQADRARVADALAALVPMPAGVTREGVLAGNRAMLDQWWDSLGLGATADWRRWKGAWPADSAR